MIFSSDTKKPKIHASAYVAQSAVISGEVEIAAGCAILHGAVLVAEGAPLKIGAETVVMENAVIKAGGGAIVQSPCSIGERCIIGPHAFIVGAKIGHGCFVASGTQLRNGSKMADSTGEIPGGDAFLRDTFNIELGADIRGRAAQTYARFLRKTHAQDTKLDEHRTTKAAPEKIPVPQTDMGGVVDAMLVEMQAMEQRRQDSAKKQRGGK